MEEGEIKGTGEAATLNHEKESRAAAPEYNL